MLTTPVSVYRRENENPLSPGGFLDVIYMNILPLVAWVGAASIALLRRHEAATAAVPESQYEAVNAPVTAQR